ncbi:hypothetical protein BT96DRAFT_986783 [Gymnopus androsaceus JB14]|uniref:DUF6589 domain-containing protein n=1 Tax=Gymnopus androsaceus JB14 TaxID=1447944 RepID=A0A6A4IED0_9AGAR|nr:hypothetical protein BT96DRAFT_986783 [Gymnopus androsaceus JB14]
MVQKGYKHWEELSEWKPSFEDLKATAEKIHNEWAMTAAAEQKKELKDDWNACSSYFIRNTLRFLEFEAAVQFADPAVIDAEVSGMEIWADGAFTHYIRLTTYDPQTKSYPLGNLSKPPAGKDRDGEKAEDEEEDEDEDADKYNRDHATCLNSDTIFDNTEENVLAFDNYEDIEGNGSLGGSDEFSSGEIIL